MTSLSRSLAIALMLIFLASPSRAQGADGAVYVLTYIDLQPNRIAAGMTLLKAYRRASRKEAGARDITLVAESGRSNRFVIAETWQDQAAFAAHDKAASTAQLRAKFLAIAQSPPDQRVHHAFATAPGARGGAVFVATHVDVTPPKQKETEGLLTRLAEDSRKDAGNLAFEVFQQDARANHFGVWAVWQSMRDFDRHQSAAHTMQFRAGVAPLLGALYDERLYRPVE
jgi:quinol monooxygenase YgiN